MDNLTTEQRLEITESLLKELHEFRLANAARSAPFAERIKTGKDLWNRVYQYTEKYLGIVQPQNHAKSSEKRIAAKKK